MTMGNKPVTAVFGFITVGQFLVGIAATIVRAKDGGKVILSEKKNHPHSLRLYLCSHTVPADTPRRISPVPVCSA